MPRHKEAENRAVRRLAATLLCELDRATDPRFEGTGTALVTELPRGDRHFSAGKVNRPLTDAEADAVLAEYFAGRGAP